MRHPIGLETAAAASATHTTTATQPAAAPRQSAVTARILLVEDEPLTAQVFAMALRRDGMQVDVCGNGLHARQRVQERKPTAVILDMSLPFRSGAEVLRELRAAGHGDLPILIVSGSDRRDSDVTSAELWPGAWISKPIRPRDLIAVVREFLPDAR
ncbi:MAG: response regulator [Planctomycetes bacterium]|nr:response regulator [Planctomycetota bacterium]